MAWLSGLAALLALHAVQGLLNTTSIIQHPEGWTIYPCWQVDHREQELDSAMMGLWYVIEIIQHRDEPQNRGIQVSDICPKLNLYKTSPVDVKLTWTERAGDVHYNFRMTDPENSGFWTIWGKQNGSMLNKVYRQFSGSVQVIEAEPSRMVLTFCSKQNNSEVHYSIIMVRNITVAHDTQDVRRSLTRYGLPEVGVRLTCQPNSSASIQTSLPSITAMFLATVFLLVHRLY